MREGRLVVAAPAKVNLYLAVGGRRPDGYHDVETVMLAIELHDVVTVEPASHLSVTCAPDLGVPPASNLAAVAVRCLADALGREATLDIRIEKRIPAGAGLGGGSSNAAAAIVAAGRLWGLDPGDARLREAGACVGADVPFFLEGGCALMTGRGDRIERRLPVPPLSLALVKPAVAVATAAAYAAFDSIEQPPPPFAAGMLAALGSDDASSVGAALYDNLSAAAIAVAPPVADALALVSSSEGVLGTCVAGSGSTVFGIYRDDEAAQAAAEEARRHDLWATATRSRDEGVTFIGEGGTEVGE